MLYVRLSTMMPRPGKEDAVAAIMDDLVSYYATQPGFVAGYKLKAADEIGSVGRVTVWESPGASATYSA